MYTKTIMYTLKYLSTLNYYIKKIIFDYFINYITILNMEVESSL